MKFAWIVFAILALANGLVGQTSATPEPKNAKAPSDTIAMARVEGERNTENTVAKPAARATASNDNEGSVAKSTAAEGNTVAPSAPATAEPPSLEDQIEQLRDLVLSQTKELAATREQMKQQQQKMQTLEEQLKSSSVSGGNVSAAQASAAAPISAAPATAAASAAAATPGGWSSGREGSPNAGGAPPVATAAQISNEASPNPEVSPLQIKLGTAYISPVGFMDFTGVWRGHDGGSGIGTNFAGIPYGGATAYQTNLSEFRFSMQNSRIGFRVDADVKGSHVIGYMEADFLGNNPANVAVTSNSNTLRSRLYWVDWRKGAWEILGGQTWSLATPNRVGDSPLPGDVFYSYNMDVNYQVGMVWGRIPEFRVTYHLPDDKAAFAIALDSPDQYVGGTNGSVAITPPACCAYYLGGEADNGTTTLGPPNRGPDVIAKFVADPSKLLHFEVGGIARFFQLYDQTTKTHFSKTGGAGFVNLDVGLGHSGLRLLTHNFWGDGGGRYIFGSAPDLIARANGSPALVHSASTVDGFEFTHQNTTIFGYWGLDYIQRNIAVDTTGCYIGWGFGPSPAGATGCTAPQSGQNRTVQEPTLGFIQNFWKNPRYGALSLIGQVSYLTRDPWVVLTGQPKNAHSAMSFIDLRYTLPGSAPTLGKPGRE
jgi:hypothetical protein